MQMTIGWRVFKPELIISIMAYPEGFIGGGGGGGGGVIKPFPVPELFHFH